MRLVAFLSSSDNVYNFVIVVILGISFGSPHTLQALSNEDRPNILWISTEDHSPSIGAYGDEYANTPTIDKLAGEGILYKNAFVSSPICAPARSAIITGMHATSLGTQNLRSDIQIPDFIKTLPEVLTEHGYFTSNNSKTDYNFDPAGRWNESDNKSHWRNRFKKDQPFFSIINLAVSHEGKTNDHNQDIFESLEERHDPDQAILPPFFPDTQEMRALWARQYDLISLVDNQTKQILDQLEEDGLDENTIVFFWSDHGHGLPRYKRWLYSTGLQVSLIVRIPEKYQHLVGLPPGSESTQLVSFVDLAPSVLSLAGINPPDYMEGVPFMGHHEEDQRTHFIAHRDRADDAYDMARSVRTDKFMFIRNYKPHLPYIQDAIIFGDGKRSYAEINRARAEGFLPASGEAMYQSRSREELYDVEADPYELNNLADDPQYKYILEEMRTRLTEWILETRDTGFLQEGEMMLRAEGSTPYEVVNDPKQYDLSRIKAAAELVGDKSVLVSVLSEMLGDNDSGVRYWAAVALLSQPNNAWKAREHLTDALSDNSPSVQIKAAEILCQLGHCRKALPVLATHLKDERDWLSLQAAISIRQLGELAWPIIPEIQQTRIKYSGTTGEGGYRDWGYAMFIGFAMDRALKNLDDRRSGDN